MRRFSTGSRPGEEVIQLYLHDVVASVTRPVKQLTGFARVLLAAGQEQEVSFAVHAERTAFTNRELQRVVEPGDIDADAVHLPGIYIHRVLALTPEQAQEKKIERLTVRPSAASDGLS